MFWASKLHFHITGNNFPQHPRTQTSIGAPSTPEFNPKTLYRRPQHPRTQTQNALSEPPAPPNSNPKRSTIQPKTPNRTTAWIPFLGIERGSEPDISLALQASASTISPTPSGTCSHSASTLSRRPRERISTTATRPSFAIPVGQKCSIEKDLLLKFAGYTHPNPHLSKPQTLNPNLQLSQVA
jgi:hypothetical protein